LAVYPQYIYVNHLSTYHLKTTFHCYALCIFYVCKSQYDLFM